jgi:tRNA threonylcarbamoyladenosine biosynthesis protein TsaB
MNREGRSILALESAICGGSISLLRNGSEVASWIGTSNVSMAEDLVANIDTLLRSNNVSLREIDLIAVSAGPGSFTGIRIGLSTALGLKTGLGIEMSSVSALKAMAFSHPSLHRVISALPAGRNAVCVQEFQRSETEVAAISEPVNLSEDEFVKLIQNKENSKFLVHAALYDKVEPSTNITNFGSKLAYAIGQIGREYEGVITEPLFISKSF